MHYVILRDDDTNALTPVDCLERLYRPFLDLGLAVNLATIPRVRSDAVRPDGRREEFLFDRCRNSRRTIPIGENEPLVRYLQGHGGYSVVQHGFDHSPNEFDSGEPRDVEKRLDEGAALLASAGFARPRTFVAPYDRFSRSALRAVARRFRVFSTGWFELGRLPRSWWPRYFLKKMRRRPHWRMGNTLLLSHPGCLLSRYRPRAEILGAIKRTVLQQHLTVLVTHWWEYFSEGRPDEPLIQVLHETAWWLAGQPDVKVIAFDDLPAEHASLS